MRAVEALSATLSHDDTTVGLSPSRQGAWGAQAGREAPRVLAAADDDDVAPFGRR